MSYYVTNENSVLNINNAHLRVSGNVITDVMKLGAIEFAPPASNVGGTVNFTNVTTGVTTSSNLSVGGTLSLGTVEVVATTHTLANTTANGNVTPHTVQFSNATTGIVTTANVEVGGELTVCGNVAVDTDTLFVDSVNDRVGVGTNAPGAELHVAGTGAIIVPNGTTAQQPTGVAGMIRFNTTTNKLQVYTGTSWQSLGGIIASGGNVTTSGGYKTHTFTTSGTFEVTSGGDIDYLIVAGGGAGATTDGGGGGGGGVVTGTMNIQPGSYTITRGGGGSYVNINDRAGNTGSNSTALGFTARGGGGGGNDRVSGQGPKTGGSGGGGGSRQSYNQWPGASGIQNSTYGYGSGNDGGDGVGEASSPPSSTRYSGGGGGAGEAGKHGSDSSDRAGGGNGIEWPSGSGTYYGGGGGGGHNVIGQGGLGGGGNGSMGNATTAGGANTGGGGGGGGNGNTRGGSGGSGIIIIRYLQ